MKNIVIRKARPADLETLLVFEQGVITAERPFDSTLKTGQTNYYDIKKMISATDVELVRLAHLEPWLFAVHDALPSST